MKKNKHNSLLTEEQEPSLFVWRGEEELAPSAQLALPNEYCRYCSTSLFFDTSENKKWCPVCGWAYQRWQDFAFGVPEHHASERFLRSFEISSDKVALSELGTHLRRNFSDIYSLSPYRFEDLIGDIFKQIGYSVEMTKKSRDGGVDIYILSGSGEKIGIIECKRYKPTRKVDITLVSKLLGTQLALDTKKAYLVTTSSYTEPAVKRSEANGIARHGFELNLLDASDILRLLKLYNEQLPPLDKITSKFIKNRVNKF
jgi:hypothetical protein